MTKIKEYKPDYLEDIKITTDIPWLWPEKLDSNVSIRGNSWWGWVKMLSFTKTAGSGIWIENFTWFWFTPTSYVIQAWSTNWTEAWTSYSSYINWNILWHYLQDVWGTTKVFDLWTRMVCVYDNAWTNTRANPSSFTSDWIKLDFISDWLSVKFTITAYS